MPDHQPSEAAGKASSVCVCGHPRSDHSGRDNIGRPAACVHVDNRPPLVPADCYCDGFHQSPAESVPAFYRRRPDGVEAMQWDPSDAAAMQYALTWLRQAGEVFKTVGQQVWIEYGERGEQFVVHPSDYLIRKTEGERAGSFYCESAERFERERELVGR